MADFNAESPAYRAMEAATETIFMDIRAGGPWSRRVVQAKTLAQTRVGRCRFDGPTRKQRLSEKVRGLTPLPPCVELKWENDNLVMVFAFGMPEGSNVFYQEVAVTNDNFEDSVRQLVEAVQAGLESIDGEKTEAIKVHGMPREITDAYPWMNGSDVDRQSDPWNLQ